MTSAAFAGTLPDLALAFSRRAPRLAWLLGAGASAMSGIPTAGALIMRFTRDLYAAEQGCNIEELDVGDTRICEQLGRYYDRIPGMPSAGDPEQYAALFERVYPDASDRAGLIEELVAGARPNFGHHALAALMAADAARVVVTTNFDDLIEQAAREMLDSDLVQPRRPLTVADLDDPDAAGRALARGRWPLVIKLHGDFRSVQLKNAPAELRGQNDKLADALHTICGQSGLIVSGYSGRDSSVIRVLTDALDSPHPFPEGLIWTRRLSEPLAPAVTDLLTAAQRRGVDVRSVAVDNFPELLGALIRLIRLPEQLRARVDGRRPAQPRTPSAMPSGPTRPWPVLRLNALPLLELPAEARRLTERRPADIGELRAALRGARARALVARLRGGALAAFGADADLAAAGEPLGVVPTNNTVPLTWSADDPDMAQIGLLTDALTLGLGRARGLRHVLRARRGHLVRVGDEAEPHLSALRRAAGGSLAGTVPGTAVSWAEAVEVHVEARAGSWWLLITPEIWVAPPGSQPAPPGITPGSAGHIRWRLGQQHAAAGFVRERLARRYNSATSEILEAWIRVLVGSQLRAVETWHLPADAGCDAVTRIGPVTAYSQPLITSDTQQGS
jgi:NAD-dependent SIR2 family protein deacetylase